MVLINPELFKLARYSVREGWAPGGALQKVAVVPPGGAPGVGGMGGDPGGGGAPPGVAGGPAGGGPPPGTAAPGGLPGGDPAAGGAPPGGGPPPGPLPPDAIQQIVQAVQQSMGGAGAAGGKKSPKEQLQASQAKITIHLLAQIASKMGIQVDPQMLVPPSDPGSDQMAMQELQNAPMLPSSDPNAPPGPGGAPGGAPGGDAGGAPPGPAPVQPMDPGQGPIGKAAGAEETAIGQEYGILKLRENRQKAAARLRLFQSLARA